MHTLFHNAPTHPTLTLKLRVYMRELRSSSEMFEIWSSLKADADKQRAKDMLRKLHEVRRMLRIATPEKVFGYTRIYIINKEVQRLLNNLDAVAVFIGIQEALHDAALGVPTGIVADILTECNALIVDY